MPAVLIRNVVVLLVLAVLAREFWHFVWRYAAALRLYHAGRYDLAGPALEKMLAVPSLFGERFKTDARYRLAWVYMSQGRFEEAAEQCRRILRRRIPAGVEMQTRGRLADCLDGLGQSEAAATERERMAPENGRGSRMDADLMRARTLDSQGRFAEACTLYAKALTAGGSAARGEDMLRFALASFHAGQPAATLQWAEQALKRGVPPNMRGNAHSIAALGCSALGRLDDCEEHRRRAVAEAIRLGNREQAAEYLGQLSSVLAQRGKTVEAIQMAEKASTMSAKARRNARLVQAECLRLWGRFDEARDMLLQARETPPLPAPRYERRSQATISLALSWTAADAGRIAEARRHLEDARAGFQGDDRVGLWCEATGVWLDALEGHAEAARAGRARVEERLPAASADRANLLTCYGKLARAASAIGDHSAALDGWQRYLDAAPPPCDEPEGWLGVGESRLALGDAGGAREAFDKAIAGGMDTRFTRLATKRLTEMGNT